MSQETNTGTASENSNKGLIGERLKGESLGEKLQTILDNLPPGGVTLAVIRDLVGQDGLLLLTAFLTIVFLVPVSIPGVSTVFGAAILLIGLCRLFGRNLWLPKQIAERVLPSEKLLAGLNRGRVWVHRMERVSRAHRIPWLASPGLMDTINNLALVGAAVLLMAPFGLIPFSNTLPALALLFFAIGLLQRDGLFIVLGHLSNVVTVIYFSVLIVGGGAAIREIFLRLVGSGS
jgi:hypothetical protein